MFSDGFFFVHYLFRNSFVCSLHFSFFNFYWFFLMSWTIILFFVDCVNFFLRKIVANFINSFFFLRFFSIYIAFCQRIINWENKPSIKFGIYLPTEYSSKLIAHGIKYDCVSNFTAKNFQSNSIKKSLNLHNAFCIQFTHIHTNANRKKDQAVDFLVS